MSRPLIDLLWREHPHASQRGARGPRSRVPVDALVAKAVWIADNSGIEALTVRSLAHELGVSAMSVYTHVNSRADLLVLMKDTAHAGMIPPAYGRTRWPTRVRRVAEANLVLLHTHPWLTEIADDRVAVGPGTIAKYDHELQAFDGAGLDDVDRDAALTFLLDFVQASAVRLAPPTPTEFADFWRETSRRLATYVGGSFQTAQRVGRAAGETMGSPYSPDHAWNFGLQRIIDGISSLTRAD